MKIIYKNISENQVVDAFQICRQKLGINFLSLEHFQNLTKENKIIIATDKNFVVGFLLFDIMPEKEFFKTKKINIKGTQKKVFIFNTCAVLKECNKIGTNLFDFAIKHLSNNIDTFYCCAWEYNNNVNIEPLCLKFNFKKTLTIKNYWYYDSINKKNFCPICNSPCTCNMILYKKC